MEIIPVLHNIRSSYNVGAILRTCDGLGIQRVVISGYTPCPNNSSGRLPYVVERERAAITKTALGAEKSVGCVYVDNLIEHLNELRDKGYILAGLENNVDSGKIYALDDAKLREHLRDKIALVLGEEVAGISPEIITNLDILVEIPMRGQKESFNVSVAAGIALWELAK